MPLVIGQFLEMVDNNTGIVGSTTGSNYHVRILSTLNRWALPWGTHCAVGFAVLLCWCVGGGEGGGPTVFTPSPSSEPAWRSGVWVGGRAGRQADRHRGWPWAVGRPPAAAAAAWAAHGTQAPALLCCVLPTRPCRELLRPSASVALHRHSNALVDILPPEADSTISVMSQTERPDVSYQDIGGMDIQKQEIREAVELPLTQVGVLGKG